MKVLLIDPVGTGHHLEYAVLLASGLKALGIQVCFAGPSSLLDALTSDSMIQDGIPLDEISFGSNYFANERTRFRFFQNSMTACRKTGAEICHFLYIDRYLTSALYGGVLRNKTSSIYATLHTVYFLPEFTPSRAHVLKGQVDFWSLRLLVSNGMRIMLHSEKITSSLKILTGQQKFDYVPYPVAEFFVTGEERGIFRAHIRARWGLSAGEVLLLVFGGTRHDKGADLAIKMLSLLPSQFHILIAGKGTFFPQAYLEELASYHGVLNRVHFDNRIIPESERPDYFCGCDIFLMPYRKNFSGQSGPLTVAAALGTKIVSPDLPVLAETISNHNLGWLYPVEDVEQMAATVLEAANSPVLKPPQKFITNHSTLAFSKAVAESYSKAKNK
ncbi:MAG: glycosyltransferase [Chloroflexi bacterium]|nr:glycosyltransferase [Chloroflexota bacterium]